MAPPGSRRNGLLLLFAVLVIGADASEGASVARTRAYGECGTIKILAVGDSVTKGAIPSKGTNKPYSHFTKDKLEQSVGFCFAVQATIAAVGGAGVIAKNGQTVLDFALPILRSEPWDWVCIMVGTNDILSLGKTAQEIWEGGLKDLYDEVLSRGGRVVAMLPLPTKLVADSDPKEKQRRDLGRLIYVYSRNHKGVYPLYYGVDWTPAQKAKWLDKDNLHLTEEGHEELGKQVFSLIRAIMGRDPCSTCSKYYDAAPPSNPQGQGGLFGGLGGGLGGLGSLLGGLQLPSWPGSPGSSQGGAGEPAQGFGLGGLAALNYFGVSGGR